MSDFTQPISISPAARYSFWRTATWWPSESNQAIQRTFIRTLALAHRERLPLGEAMDNFASEQRGLRRLRYRRFSRRILDGDSMVDAVEQTAGVLDEEPTMALRYGQQSGTLGKVYETLLSKSIPQSRTVVVITLHLLVIAYLILVIGSFFFFFIFPTLEVMLDEFGVNAPLSFNIVSGLAGWFPAFFFAFCGIFIFWVLMYLSATLRRWVRRKVSKVATLLKLQNYHATVLELLSISLSEGRPLASGLSILGRHHFNGTVRKRLLFARNEIEQGADEWETLARIKFLTVAEAQALRECPDHRSRGWLLQRFATRRGENIRLRRERIARLMQPLVLVFFAGIVLLFGMVHFQAMSQLTNAIASWTND